MGRTTNFHTNIVIPPETIPASAPCFVVRFQKSAARTTGPNAAPKPAQAKDTIWNTELFNEAYQYSDMLFCNNHEAKSVMKYLPGNLTLISRS